MATGAQHRVRVSFRLAAGLLLVSLLAPLAAAQPPWWVCGSTGSYTENSTYQSSLNQLFATVPTNASRDLYAIATVGAAPEIVYAVALCRGDTDASTCESCVAAAFPEAQQLCGFDKCVTVFYDDCILRYSNKDILADSSNGNLTMIMSQQNVSSPVKKVFDDAVAMLLNDTANYAAMNTSRRFATGEQGFDSRYYPTIYGLVQCTPDMSPAACQSCLGDIIALTPQLSGRQSGRIIGVRCNFRYDLDKFFVGDPTLRLQTPFVPAPNNGMPTSTPEVMGSNVVPYSVGIIQKDFLQRETLGVWPCAGQRSDRLLCKAFYGVPFPIDIYRRTKNKMKIVALPVVAAMLAIAIFSLCFLRRRLAREHMPSYSTKPEDFEGIGSLLLHLSTIRAATDNFAESNWVGQGGFGAVYKGVLPDGQEVAVKRFSQGSGQEMQELKNELVLIARLQHKNLVRLVGVCLEEHEKLLVYEYLPNRSMDTILFDPEKSKELDWGRRFNIINGIARGLNYLHEDSQLKIIHRDLKASNVLLDSDYTPKISDFGLARLFAGDQSQEATNSVVGTYGYMSPEYAMRGHYSVKSDVFSFGVLILEILTGRRSSGSYSFDESVDLISLVWEHWTTGTITEIIDSSMRGNAPGDQMLKCIHIGLLCVQDNPMDRPVMSKVIVMLSSGTVSLQAPLKPEFFIPKSGPYSSTFPGSYPRASQSTSKSQSVSSNEVSIAEMESR